MRHWQAVTLASILARRSCTIWNEAIALPNCSRSWAYLSVASNAPICTPVEAQPTMYRVIRSTRAVSRNELPPCRQAVCLRNPDVLECNLAVLDHFERHLVLDFLNAKAGRGLVL